MPRQKIPIQYPQDSQPVGGSRPDAPTQVGTLTFDLTDPEGQRSIELALKAPKMLSALWDVDNWLRDQLKYGGVEELKTPSGALDAARKQLHQILEDYDLRLE